MMTSAYLLEEAIRIKDDVNSKLQYIQQSTRSARAGSAMMKSAVTMPLRRDRTQQDDAMPPPPPPPPQLTPYERASMDMIAGITRLLERQSERPGKLHEEDVAERFRKQGPKEFIGTTDPLVAEEWIRSLETIYAYMGLSR
ncbi:hypothetical protein F511_40886 [Dorcoceras hygrometricum]|uniref:Uncharacterized protein n=1 Tax=Dorcoceras hygrometricum TaxID=472368 RepID=A0A2Z7D9L6_9LAMI|nr:hypothetical protein F511_40886 [Dorcoceras hygrometricum]